MLADDAGDVTHYFSCLEFPDFFFLWNIESPWIHEFISEKHFGSWLSTPPEGSESFISEMVESEVWKSDVDFVVVGKGDMGFDTPNFDRWSRQFWKIFWKWWGVSFGKYGVFCTYNIEVIRLTFLDLDEIGLLIKQRLTQESRKVFKGFKWGGVVAQKKNSKLFNLSSGFSIFLDPLGPCLENWGCRGVTWGDMNKKTNRKQKAFFFVQNGLLAEKDILKIKGGSLFLGVFSPFFLATKVSSKSNFLGDFFLSQKVPNFFEKLFRNSPVER